MLLLQQDIRFLRLLKALYIFKDILSQKEYSYEFMSWNELLMIIVLSGWDQSLKHLVFLWGHFNLCTFVFSVKMRECRVWKAKEQSCDDVTANKKVQRRKCKVVKEKERNWRTTSSRRVHVPFLASTL